MAALVTAMNADTTTMTNRHCSICEYFKEKIMAFRRKRRFGGRRRAVRGRRRGMARRRRGGRIRIGYRM